MNRMIKIFIGIFCFIAIFSCNNDDNITTTKVNGATTNTIDDGMATVEIRIHDGLATDGDVPSLQGRIGDGGNIWLYVKEYDSETQQDKYELLKLKLLE